MYQSLFAKRTSILQQNTKQTKHYIIQHFYFYVQRLQIVCSWMFTHERNTCNILTCTCFVQECGDNQAPSKQVILKQQYVEGSSLVLQVYNLKLNLTYFAQTNKYNLERFNRPAASCQILIYRLPVICLVCYAIYVEP